MPGYVTYDATPPGMGGMSLATAPSLVTQQIDPMETVEQLGRVLRRDQAEFGITDPNTGEMIQGPEPTVAPDVLNRRYRIDGPTPALSLSFAHDMPESVAADMNAAKRDEILRANAQGAAPHTFANTLGVFGLGMLDPIGLAASAMPVFGEARAAQLLGRLGVAVGEGFAGRTAARAVAGAISGAGANVPVAALRYGLSQQEGMDYGFYEAARDVAYGAPMGAVLHPLGGALVDLLGHTGAAAPAAPGEPEAPAPAALPDDAPIGVHAATMQAAVAAVMDDAPVNAGGTATLAWLRAQHEQDWLSLSQDAEALSQEIATLPAGAAPDAATQARLAAVADDLARPGLTADARAALQNEQHMLTEGAQPTPEADALEAARTGAQRSGLQIALDRTQARIAEVEARLKALYEPGLREAYAPEGDAAAPGAPPARVPFADGFPKVVVMQAPNPAVRMIDHPDYAAAKAGDADAALNVVVHMLNPARVAALKEMLGDRRPVLVAPHQAEAAGARGNALPGIFADVLGMELGLPVDTAIAQTNRTGRTGSDMLHRLRTTARFNGPVAHGGDYLLVDDVVTQGGTLADLHGYIRNHGGNVLGATTLVQSTGSHILAPRSATLDRLRGQFPGVDAAYLAARGHDASGLTDSEALALLRPGSFGSTDAIRDRVLARTETPDARLRAGTLLAEEGGTGGQTGGGSEAAAPLTGARRAVPDATTIREAEAAAAAAPVPMSALSPALSAELDSAERLVAHARAAGALSKADDAELARIDDTAATTQGHQDAIAQAGACVARGL